MLVYVLIYAVWSRIAFENSRRFGDIKSFHYLPVDVGYPEYLEIAFRTLFFPINWLDQYLLKSPWPEGLIDKELSFHANGSARLNFNAKSPSG